MIHRVRIAGTGESFACGEDLDVLAAMEQARCRGIPVGCRNGGCGACKVRITAGRFRTAKMNRAVVTAAEEQQGCALACRTFALSDLEIHVMGRVWQAASPSQLASFDFGFARTASNPRPDKET